jgi:hypothetical protein
MVSIEVEEARDVPGAQDEAELKEMKEYEWRSRNASLRRKVKRNLWKKYVKERGKLPEEESPSN